MCLHERMLQLTMQREDDAQNQLAILEYSNGRELLDVVYWLQVGRLHNGPSPVFELNEGVKGCAGVS